VFALKLLVSVMSNISLLLAASDLAVVKSITSAMHAADVASGKGIPACALGPAPNHLPAARVDCFEKRHHFLSTPVYEERKHFHPTPVYERRPVIHPTPRIGLEKLVPAPSEGAPATKLLPPPPWKMLPWNIPTKSPEIVKKVVRVNDKVRNGQFIDLFI